MRIAAGYQLGQGVEHGCLQPGEGEIQVVFVHHRAGQLEALRVALFGQLVDFRAAGVGQVKHLGHLVEGLAGGIIAGSAQQGVVSCTLNINDEAVAAAYHQAQVGNKPRRVGDEGGKHVPLQVVDRYKRLAGSQCQGLGCGVAHQQGGHQTGACCAGKDIHLVNAAACFLQRLLQHGGQIGGVIARGELGNHAAVHAVQGNLRGNDGAEQLRLPAAGVLHESHGSFITTRFDSQYQHVTSCLPPCGV